jgi:molybdopterin-guanine dinucleotide biosynthesis protein A
LFLACDMPFVSPQLILHAIRRLELAVRRQEAKTRGQSTHQGPAGAAHAPPIFVFTRSEGVAGFPLALTLTCRAAVLAQIETGDFSLQKLARTLKALPVPLPPALLSQLRNVNTPSDWNRAQALWNHRQKH